MTSAGASGPTAGPASGPPSHGGGRDASTGGAQPPGVRAEASNQAARERRRGPVTLRRDAVSLSTADQRLLDSRLRAAWKTKDGWRALRILSEFVEGFDSLA